MTERPWPLRPVDDARLALVYHQLAGLLQAGIATTQALGLLARRSRGPLRDALATTRDGLAAGKTLGDALDPTIFPESTRALVRAGETTGGLPAVFAELAAALELRLSTRRRVIRACVYPFLLFSLSFFLPPLSRLVTAGLGAYLRASLLPYLGALALIAAAVVLVPWGARALLGPARLGRLPLVGAAVRSTFAGQLAAAWRAGLGAHTALSLAAHATGDPDFVRQIERASDRIKGGATLEDALAASGLFDEDFLLAVAGGEAAGQLDVALATHARYLRETRLHRLEVIVQVTAVAILLAVYAYVGWRLYADMRAMMNGPEGELLQELEQLEPGALPPELQ